VAQVLQVSAPLVLLVLLVLLVPQVNLVPPVLLVKVLLVLLDKQAEMGQPVLQEKWAQQVAVLQVLWEPQVLLAPLVTKEI
jgi:hypothetical protein